MAMKTNCSVVSSAPLFLSAQGFKSSLHKPEKMRKNGCVSHGPAHLISSSKAILLMQQPPITSSTPSSTCILTLLPPDMTAAVGVCSNSAQPSGHLAARAVKKVS